MAGDKDKGGITCKGSGQHGMRGAAPGAKDKCPVCTAQPRVLATGLLREHDMKAPRWL